MNVKIRFYMFILCSIPNIVLGRDYGRPINQLDDECNPKLVEILWIQDTSLIHSRVKKFNNIRVIIIENSEITSLPSYFLKFEKLEEIIFENCKTLPDSFINVPKLKKLEFLSCKNLIIDSNFYLNLLLDEFRIFNCKNLDISHVKAKKFELLNVNGNWNISKSKLIVNCETFVLRDNDFLLIEEMEWEKSPRVINLEMCSNVIVDRAFYVKFNKLWRVNIIGGIVTEEVGYQENR